MDEAKRVLLVDDEPDFIDVMKKNLESEGFVVDVAYDGNEGWEKLQKTVPDAVILDVMMPEKDGYDLCSEIKESSEYSSIPVIMLTAVASHVPSTRYSHHNGMMLEADDYFPKPASAEQILGSLKRLLKM